MSLKRTGRKSPLNACWDGYSASGTKPSPSGKKTSSGKIKMVPDCKKDSPANMNAKKIKKNKAAEEGFNK